MNPDKGYNIPPGLNAFTYKPREATKGELRKFNIAYTNSSGGRARAKNQQGVAVKLTGTNHERKPK